MNESQSTPELTGQRSPAAVESALLGQLSDVPYQNTSKGVVRGQNLARAWIGDAQAVLALLWLVLTTALAWVRPRHDLVLEDLLLRHHLAVSARPTRTRPRARLRTRDQLLRVLARRWCARWREHLALVAPDTVVRWHRQGWRRFWRRSRL